MNKELATAYISLSKQLHQQYHQRRSLEWQMHLALWTLLAAAAYAFATQALSIHRGLLIGALGIAAVAHFVFAVKIHIGQIKEQDLSILYRTRAESFLDNPQAAPSALGKDASIDTLPMLREERSAMPERFKGFFKNYWWWLGAEMTVTLLISAAVYGVAVSAVPRPTPEALLAFEHEVSHMRTELVQLRERLATTEATLDKLQRVRLTDTLQSGVLAKRPVTIAK